MKNNKHQEKSEMCPISTMEPKQKFEVWIKQGKASDQEFEEELEDMARADDDDFAIVQEERLEKQTSKKEKEHECQRHYDPLSGLLCGRY